jgi:hypothetical protein
MSDTSHRVVGRTTTAGSALTDTISIDEIIARYPGEWILIRVSKRDEDGWPERGYLLDRASTKTEILKATERWAPMIDGEGGPLYAFLAEPLIKSGPEYATAVAAFFAGLIQAAGEHGARARKWDLVSAWVAAGSRARKSMAHCSDERREQD